MELYRIHLQPELEALDTASRMAPKNEETTDQGRIYLAFENVHIVSGDLVEICAAARSGYQDGVDDYVFKFLSSRMKPHDNEPFNSWSGTEQQITTESKLQASVQKVVQHQTSSQQFCGHHLFRDSSTAVSL